MTDEVQKLQTHLQLLREEYVKLQKKLIEKESNQTFQSAVALKHDEDFLSKLLKFVSELHSKSSYSDLKIKIDGVEIPGHKFVFKARSENWGIQDFSEFPILDLSDMPENVAHTLVRWVYSGKCEAIYESDGDFVVSLMTAAQRFFLSSLKASCEQNLISRVSSADCIKYFQIADGLFAKSLSQHCLKLISNYWEEFQSKDFACLSANTAYKIFKSTTQYPLHTSIRMKREDVVFLFMIEFDSQLPEKLNEMDNKGDLAIDLALKDHQDGIAQALISHKVDVDRPDGEGYCLLHKAISRGDEYSAKFLIENGCDVNAHLNKNKETPLHVTASYNSDSIEISDGMCRIAGLLIRNGCCLNAQDASKCTALHRSICNNNVGVFSVLLEHHDLDLNVQDIQGQTPLWLALNMEESMKKNIETTDGYVVNSLASQLVSKGCSVDISNEETGNTMLHESALNSNEAAGLFLVNHKADPNITNLQGETPLHISCRLSLSKLVQALLDHRADVNIQTMPTLGFATAQPKGQTPLHLAVRNGFQDIVQLLLNNSDSLEKPLKLELKDSQDEVPLAVALWSRNYEIAELLVKHGADVNSINEKKLSLIHEAILKKDSKSSLFLLDHGVDYTYKSSDGISPLEMAIDQNLADVVDKLCSRGCDVNMIDKFGNCVLWKALDAHQFDVADVLVRNKCDVNFWSVGPNNCQQTLLHRAIDENNEDIACFLIDSRCDVNSPRRPGINGSDAEEGRDKQGPLHLSASWGLVKVLQSLIEAEADVNVQDAEGDTPLHIGIKSQHHDVIFLLLSHPNLNLSIRNKKNQTPFSIAMTTRNNKAAYAIIDRAPTAAEQLDNKGRTFLHLAIESKDLESVLFLISVCVNVNFRVQDSTQRTPLHIAVSVGDEMIVRNLLLAGARIDDTNSQKQTSLHLASIHDRHVIASILIDNHIDCNALDDSLNNAFHLACQFGHLNVVKVLLNHSNVNITATNLRGQNPLHVLGHYGKENSAAIFDLIVECYPQYPVDQPNVNGNTVLMLAYFNGNSALCKAAVKFGAKLATVNKDGVSIFNVPVATNQLINKLLDMLNKEPPWSDGENCLQCDIKFGLTTRKHHCRHCGRILCARCSVKDIPIVKFGLLKPVRVCDVCFEVLTVSSNN